MLVNLLTELPPAASRIGKVRRATRPSRGSCVLYQAMLCLCHTRILSASRVIR